MLPDLSPLIYSDRVCDRCARTMKKQVVKNKQGRALHIEYRCENAETGCAYTQISDERASGMQAPIRDTPKEK